MKNGLFRETPKNRDTKRAHIFTTTVEYFYQTDSLVQNSNSKVYTRLFKNKKPEIFGLDDCVSVFWCNQMIVRI